MQVLVNPTWPDEFPFDGKDFKRQDEAMDSVFYDSARLVAHIDNGAIESLTK